MHTLFWIHSESAATGIRLSSMTESYYSKISGLIQEQKHKH